MNTLNPNFSTWNFFNFFFEKFNDHYDVIKASLIFMSCLKTVWKEGQNGSNSNCYIYWWNKPVFHNFWKQNNNGLFHQLFEPLKIHQTILNSNQTIHKTSYLMKMDKSDPKNNNSGSLIWKRFNNHFCRFSLLSQNLADIYTIIRSSN